MAGAATNGPSFIHLDNDPDMPNTCPPDIENNTIMFGDWPEFLKDDTMMDLIIRAKGKGEAALTLCNTNSKFGNLFCLEAVVNNCKYGCNDAQNNNFWNRFADLVYATYTEHINTLPLPVFVNVKPRQTRKPLVNKSTPIKRNAPDFSPQTSPTAYQQPKRSHTETQNNSIQQNTQLRPPKLNGAFDDKYQLYLQKLYDEQKGHIRFTFNKDKIGHWLILPQSPTDRTKLLNVTTVGGKKLQIKENTTLSYQSYHSLYCFIDIDIDEQPLTENAGVVNARRIHTIMPDKTSAATRRVVIKFNGTDVPNFLDCGPFANIRIFALNPDISRCFRCQKIGHNPHKCRNRIACGLCTREHFTRDCPKNIRNNKDNANNFKPKCANCQGEHPALFIGCPYRKATLETLFKQPEKPVIAPPIIHSNHDFPVPANINKSPSKTVTNFSYADAISSGNSTKITRDSDDIASLKLIINEQSKTINDLTAQVKSLAISLANLKIKETNQPTTLTDTSKENQCNITPSTPGACASTLPADNTALPPNPYPHGARIPTPRPAPVTSNLPVASPTSPGTADLAVTEIVRYMCSGLLEEMRRMFSTLGEEIRTSSAPAKNG